jgi:3-phosphoshikimate 1-carboxyvinyltransferase
MDLTVERATSLSGEIRIPPSKLHTQFSSVLALLAKGKSTIENPLRVKDTLCLLRAIEGMGAVVKKSQDQWSVWGLGQELKQMENVVDVRNSGTSLCLMTSVASISPRVTVLTGDAQLRNRKISQLISAFQSMGVQVYSVKPDDSPPLVVFGGKLKGGKVSFQNRVGNCYLPALMLPCPFAEKPFEFSFSSPPSSPQVSAAEELMKTAGAEVVRQGKNIKILNQPYDVFNAKMPQDLAATAPFIVASLFTSSKLKLKGSNRVSGRDILLLKILDQMGASIDAVKGGFSISGPQKLKGTKINLEKSPELLPSIAVIACNAHGKTVIYNAHEARQMKSDRISAMARELKKMGARVVERSDGLVIEGPNELKGTKLDGHDDYAVVAALASACLLADGKSRIANRAEALQTSYSRFVSTFQELGAEINYVL